MERAQSPRDVPFIQIALFLLLLLLWFIFQQGWVLVLGAASLLLLMAYHLYVDIRLKEQSLANIHIVLYLALCTFVVWSTRASGNEESPFWIVFFLPIVVTASQKSLKATLATCSAALVLFIAHVPPEMYLEVQERKEALPELVGFGVMFYLVGTMVQMLAQQIRRQLALKVQLNEKLLENQQRLKDSLARLEAAEESLRIKERLASLGEMSAGIAHEIRNPLGIISSSAQLLDREIANADARQLLDIIQEESSRLNGLITDFLTFGRQLDPHCQVTDMEALIVRAMDQLRPAAEHKDIILEFGRQCGDCRAEVDADMLQQVLLNLLLNALQATPPGGSIRISLARSAEHLFLHVRDTGCGIPPDIIGKVFDPFFTTKSDGTGLGLANAYKIIESHDGTLEVVSRVEEGTTFSIKLPLEK